MDEMFNDLNLELNLNEFSAIINAMVKNMDIKIRYSISQRTAFEANTLGIVGQVYANLYKFMLHKFMTP